MSVSRAAPLAVSRASRVRTLPRRSRSVARARVVGSDAREWLRAQRLGRAVLLLRRRSGSDPVRLPGGCYERHAHLARAIPARRRIRGRRRDAGNAGQRQQRRRADRVRADAGADARRRGGGRAGTSGARQTRRGMLRRGVARHGAHADEIERNIRQSRGDTLVRGVPVVVRDRDDADVRRRGGVRGGVDVAANARVLLADDERDDDDGGFAREFRGDAVGARGGRMARARGVAGAGGVGVLRVRAQAAGFAAVGSVERDERGAARGRGEKEGGGGEETRKAWVVWTRPRFERAVGFGERERTVVDRARRRLDGGAAVAGDFTK